MGKRINTEQFTERAKELHGDKYDYSKVEYVKMLDRITIICKEHGEFEQIASNHLKGQGCRRCGIEYRAKNQKSNKAQFIYKAIKVHGDKYDYSNVEYKGGHNKINIVCHMHGEFIQSAASHLQGIGCPKCGWKKAADIRAQNINVFIEKANIIHNNKYDYSLVEYKNNSTKIKIVCPEHGVFLQAPNNHISSSNETGCPICKESKGERMVAIELDNLEICYKREYKFNDCKNIKPLPFDFYIPSINTCIEYDGRQHFKSIELFGGEEGFKQRQINDLIKDKYCKDKGIKLIRISYRKKNKINNILKEVLNV